MIPAWLKSIWHDPVGSKVIAQGILYVVQGLVVLIVAAAGWLLYHYRNGGTPLWVSVVLVVIIVALGLSLFFALRYRRTSTLPIDGLLTPLQIETLQLAKELNDLLKTNPLPKKTDYGYKLKLQRWDVGSRIQAFGEARNSVEQKLRAKYAMSFQPKTITLYHRLVTEAAVDDYNLETLAKGEGRAEDIANLVAALRKVVFTLEDARLGREGG
jgi:hypothetical protein